MSWKFLSKTSFTSYRHICIWINLILTFRMGKWYRFACLGSSAFALFTLLHSMLEHLVLRTAWLLQNISFISLIFPHLVLFSLSLCFYVNINKNMIPFIVSSSSSISMSFVCALRSYALKTIKSMVLSWLPSNHIIDNAPPLWGKNGRSVYISSGWIDAKLNYSFVSNVDNSTNDSRLNVYMWLKGSRQITLCSRKIG